MPTMIEVGVASPIAHGQAMIITATAFTSANPSAGAGPNTIQTMKVISAAVITAGTNHIVTRSTRVWMGSLAPCADSTIRMICASTVWPPTAVARTVKAPVWLTVPPTTVLPAVLATGTGSPVIIDSST